LHVRGVVLDLVVLERGFDLFFEVVFFGEFFLGDFDGGWSWGGGFGFSAAFGGSGLVLRCRGSWFDVDGEVRYDKAIGIDTVRWRRV
jgi:hypothetical protein